MKPRYLVICNPESRRWSLYQETLLAYWHELGVTPEIHVLPWFEVITKAGVLDPSTWGDERLLARIESPGENPAVSQALRCLGANTRGLGAYQEARFTRLEQPGELLAPRLAFRGFHEVLRGLKNTFAQAPHWQPLACPLDIAVMFDKNATCSRLLDADIPCPATLPVQTSKLTPQELLRQLMQMGWKTAYIKLATGSSATGMVVIHLQDRPVWGLTTVTRRDNYFFNTRIPERIEGESLEEVLRFLCNEGVCIQQGITMATIDGLNFDVRVVVIHGEPAFTLFRLSPLPMTNLQLGGRRGDWARCRAAIPPRAWANAMDDCVTAARLFNAACVGIDLLFDKGFTNHYLLEINAFGDFFPGWRNPPNAPRAAGKSIHEWEIAQTARFRGLE